MVVVVVVIEAQLKLVWMVDVGAVVPKYLVGTDDVRVRKSIRVLERRMQVAKNPGLFGDGD